MYKALFSSLLQRMARTKQMSSLFAGNSLSCALINPPTNKPFDALDGRDNDLVSLLYVSVICVWLSELAKKKKHQK